MTNVSVGDVFMSNTEIFKVVEISKSKMFPDDPWFLVKSYKAGYGWHKTDLTNDGFLLSEVKQLGFKYFKQTEL